MRLPFAASHFVHVLSDYDTDTCTDFRRRISRNGRVQTTAIVLCLTIFGLFISTTAYLVTCILYYQSDFLDSFLSAPDLLWPGTDLVDIVPEDLMQEDKSGLSMTAGRQACASAATLTINVRLGSSFNV